MIGQPNHDLTAYGRLLVRRAVLRDDWIADDILDLAAGDRIAWSTEDWDALLAELAASQDTIEDWLVLNS